jgi:flagellar assembly factor FliW
MTRARSGARTERVKHRTTVGGNTVDRKDIISFPEGLPGFEGCRGFVLLSSPEMAPLQQLHSVVGPEATFVGIDPKLALPGYRCDLSTADLQRLGATDDSVLLWLALVAIDADGTVSVNLRAPIVINPANMIGHQVMPYDCLYPIRQVITGLD